MRNLILMLLVGAIFSLNCNTVKLDPKAMAAKLGQEWVINSLMGNKLNPSNFIGGLPSLNFDTDKGLVNGKLSCNNVNGKFDVTKGLDFSNLVSTRKACAKGADEESQILNSLQKVNNFGFKGDELELKDGKNVLMSLLPKK